LLTVACTLKSGGIYTAAWVEKLRASVAEHLPLPHRFLCMSDVDCPDRIPLAHDWPGWWSKVEAFRIRGPVLFFDLDTAIVGDLTPFAEQAERGEFTVLRDFYRPDGFGSGVMAWNVTQLNLYRNFADNPEFWMRKIGGRGDQGFIEEVAYLPSVTRWQDVLGDQVVSYKVHCRAGIPADARVVCLHGKPKFEDMPAGDPVRVAWEQAA
jgi:hypothetical protein